MGSKIDSFKNGYAFLSNFTPCEVTLDGVVYPTVENAYQAAKTLGDRDGFVVCTAGESKALGRAVELRPDWESIKIITMIMLLEQKFKPGTEFATMLEETEDAELIEGNWWNDTFWGVCRGEGQNVLGKILMSIRRLNRQEKSL